MLLLCSLCLTCSGTICYCQEQTTVRSYGAAGDGKSIDTTAIQSAIDGIAARGGGDVVFPAGTYLTGSIHLKSNITLRLQAGSTIKGIRSLAAYDPPEVLGFKNASDRETSFFHLALIWGEDISHVSIVGEGQIDSNFVQRLGPKPIALKRCQFIKIQGITIKNAPNYNISLIGTDYVEIEGVTILHGLADGIDPDSCRNIRISNCHIECEDDAIVLKSSYSLGEHRSCDNVVISNCFLSTYCNCFKIGTETGSDFQHIALDNCVMCGLARVAPASSGIALESVDGANIAGVTISNVSMFFVRSPVFVRLGNRGRDMPTPQPGSLRNVSISHVVVEDASQPCMLSGIPGSDIEDVSLTDFRIRYTGANMLAPPGYAVPEQTKEYPDPDMFGPLPADGLYVRHVRKLTLRDINLQCKTEFWRLSVLDDRKVDWNQAPPSPSSASTPKLPVWIQDTDGVRISGLSTWIVPHSPSAEVVNSTNMIVNSLETQADAWICSIRGKRCKNIRVNRFGVDNATFSLTDGAPQSVLRMN